MDIVGGVMLANGSEVKVVTGVDDHSRYCVIAAVVPRATGRAVCLALVDALRRFGIPDELLTDNGKQFTARFNRPRRGGDVRPDLPGERDRPPADQTPLTHHDREGGTLPPDVGAGAARRPSTLRFASRSAQTVIDAFRVEYNTNRPHQSLRMEFPADRFKPRPVDELGLRIPPRLTKQPAPTIPPIVDVAAVAPVPAATLVLSSNGVEPVDRAVEVDRMVPPSGNLSVCGQQFWLGPTSAASR